MLRKQNKGFTLLEILLVIATIGILASIVLVAINPNRQLEAARNAKRRADINSITKAIQQYSIDNNGQYPAGIETGAKPICSTDNTPTGCVNLSTTLSPTYIASIPISDSNRYYVRKNTAGTSIEVSHPRDNIWNIGGTPSLDLNFAKNKSLIDGVSGNNLITFTRAETTPTANRATYVGEDGLIKTAAANEARFDHNPTTGESLGLLVEEERTNLLTYSEQFDNAAWSKSNASITANALSSPDGTVTAETFVESTDGSNAGHYINNNFNVTNGTAYTFTVFAKYVSRQWLVLTGNRDNWQAYFDIQNGVTGNKGSLVSSSSITALPNGWFRCSATVVADSTISVAFQIFPATSNGTTRVPFYTGTGANAFYIWGAQLEAGSFATSYIPTTTAAVTRAADVASITGTNFSSWFNNTEGTLFSDFRLEADRSGTRWAAQIGPTALTGPNSNVIGKVETNLVYAETRNNSVTQYLASRTFPSSRRAKIVYAIKNLDHQAAFDGVLSAAGTGTLGTPSNTVLFVGRNVASTEMLNGTIARLTYWPTRLSNTVLQNITQ